MHGCFFLILKRVPENTLKKLFVYCSSSDRAAFVPKMNAAVAISSVGKQGNELDVWAQRGLAKTPRDTRLDNQEIRAVNRDSTSEISSKFRIPATPLPQLPFSESVVFVTQVRLDCCCCCCVFWQDPCASNPCKDKQICEPNVGPRGYKCACPEGYTGEACEGR